MDDYDANLLAALKWHARNNKDRLTRIAMARAYARILKLTKE